MATAADSPPSVVLYQFPRSLSVPNVSPFCVKVETYLRMAGIPYELDKFDPRKAPKGKAPFIVHGDQTIADSSNIIAYLKEAFGDPLDAHLTPEQRALGTLVQRTLEEHTYWVAMYFRWVANDGWKATRTLFEGLIPTPIRQIAVPIIRRSVKKAAWGQGLSRHDRAEIIARGKADLDAVLTLMGDKPYVLGDRPTSHDAFLFGLLINGTEARYQGELIDNELTAYCRAQPRIVDYVQRIKRAYWADWSPEDAATPAPVAPPAPGS